MAQNSATTRMAIDIFTIFLFIGNSHLSIAFSLGSFEKSIGTIASNISIPSPIKPVL